MTLAEPTTVTLVTGGNQGLGYETVRRLLAAGQTVLLSARDAARGRRAADELGAQFVPLDVTDDASVTAAAQMVQERYGRLDVLVNNAGIVGPTRSLVEVSAAEVRATLDTNLVGVVRVTRAFLPLLRAGRHPRIVNVSSGTGRFTWQRDNGWPQEHAVYSMTKVALTMLTQQYAAAMPDILVNAAWPGYTATALNDHQGTQTVTEGTDAIVHLATLGPDGPTGILYGRGGPTSPC